MQPEDSPQSGAQGPQVEDLDIIYTPSFLEGTIKNGRC